MEWMRVPRASVCLVSLLAVCWPSLPVAAYQATGLELPPRVVACTPAQFETGVSTSLEEVRLVFDRPMDTGTPPSIGSVPWLGVFPAASGVTGSWDSTGTICTIPVALEPDVTYAFVVNAHWDTWRGAAASGDRQSDGQAMA